MKLVIFMALVIGIFATQGNSQTADLKAKAEDLAWMAGCWESTARGGAVTIFEQWMKPAGGTLIGMSRTVAGGKTVAWESIRIVADADGLSYIAKPNTNKEETVFKLAKSTASEIIFENPVHDFPQRVIYRNTGTDSLFARIEGTRGGKFSGMDIPMKRAACY